MHISIPSWTARSSLIVILHRLGSYARQHRVHQALNELGGAVPRAARSTTQPLALTTPLLPTLLNPLGRYQSELARMRRAVTDTPPTELFGRWCLLPVFAGGRVTLLNRAGIVGAEL